MKTKNYTQSKGYMWVADRVKHGKPLLRILDGFNMMHRLHPQEFYSSIGKELTLLELLYWLEEILTEQPVKKTIECKVMSFDLWVRKSFAYWWIRKQLRKKVASDTIIDRFNRYNSLLPTLFVSWHGGSFSLKDYYRCLAFYEKDNIEQRNNFYRNAFNDLEVVYKSEISSGWNSYPVRFDPISNTVIFATPYLGLKTYELRGFGYPKAYRAVTLDKATRRKINREIRNRKSEHNNLNKEDSQNMPKYSKANFQENYISVEGIMSIRLNLLLLRGSIDHELYIEGSDMSKVQVLSTIILSDVLRCVEKSCRYIVSDDELVAMKYAIFRYFCNEEGYSFQEWLQAKEEQEICDSIIRNTRKSPFYQDNPLYEFSIVDILFNNNMYLEAENFFRMLRFLAYSVAYADDVLTETESAWLELLDADLLMLMEYSDPYRDSATIVDGPVEIDDDVDDGTFVRQISDDIAEDDVYDIDIDDDEDYQYQEDEPDDEDESEDDEGEDEYDDPIERLNELVGLTHVKSDVNSLKNLIQIQLMRAERGMKGVKVSYHCVFTGNPGTGKTTVTRILARIYKDLGILSKGHLIETDRSGLVADYVGQTATKTNAIIDKALDGVLFVDEAYALSQGGDNDFGKEAISTLLKRMEDDRKRLVVILAGYNKEMKEFMNSNSGLKSRFSRYIDFPDYSIDELIDIFMLMASKSDYRLSYKAKKKLRSVITDAFNNKEANFGNARYVRNLFESAISRQASRLIVIGNPTNNDLETITSKDIE